MASKLGTFLYPLGAGVPCGFTSSPFGSEIATDGRSNGARSETVEAGPLPVPPVSVADAEADVEGFVPVLLFVRRREVARRGRVDALDESDGRGVTFILLDERKRKGRERIDKGRSEG